VTEQISLGSRQTDWRKKILSRLIDVISTVVADEQISSAHLCLPLILFAARGRKQESATRLRWNRENLWYTTHHGVIMLVLSRKLNE